MMFPAICDPSTHKFAPGTTMCMRCGWELPRTFTLEHAAPVAPHVDGLPLDRLVAFMLNPPIIRELEPAPQTVLLDCPACGELGQSDAEIAELTCSHCLHRWTRPALRTAGELIRFIRETLEGDQDASRRSFYNAHKVLYAIAQAVDAYPDPVDKT